MTAGTNQRDTWSASRWIGARERCAALTIWTIWAISVSRPTLPARITNEPDWLTVPPMTLPPASLVTGIDSPVTIDSSTAERPSIDLAVDRHLVAGPHAQLVADRDRVERYVLVAAVRLDAPRGLGRKFEQRADRARRRLARAQFQHLAEQHQHGDDGGGLEIDRDRAVVAAERRRKHVRRERRDHAVDVGDAGAHRDQREHVEIARDQRLPAAHEERPARPQHDRRGERELNPVRRCSGD